MNTKIFEAFDLREKKVNQFMAGCGQRYGGRCTCGMDCECAGCPIHPRAGKKEESVSYQSSATQSKPQKSGGCCGGGEGKGRRNSMDNRIKSETYGRQSTNSGFGRALSALSALSIDWENMEDFDVNVDHSAHINNSDVSARHPQKVSEKEAELIYEGCAMMYGGICNCGPTCVCVGCPIHDKDNARENQSSAAVTTDSPYHFGHSEKTIKRPNLRSSLLYKKKEFSNQVPPNHGVTFQV